MTMAILLVLGFVALAVFMAAPRRKHRLPATEQFVLSLLHLSAWIERTATAMDAAIVRYRIERLCLEIRLESTNQREIEGASL
jgi:putative Mn2+ efflux pump MntP